MSAISPWLAISSIWSRPRVRRAGRILERTLAVIGLGLIVYHAGFELTCVMSGSMAPLLKGRENGGPDWALFERVSKGRVPARFQVVSFTNEEGIQVAKRVVGLPGETVAITSRTLVIDGAPVASPEGVGRGGGYLAAGNVHHRSYTVPEGHVYVLGDDSQDSQDSRFEGAIPLASIEGRAVLRVWPLARLKWLL